MLLLPRIVSCLALCCGTLNAFAAVVIETADGLPVEVEVVSAYRDDLTVRYTASQREAQLKLSQLDEISQKKITETVAGMRGTLDPKAFRFEARLEENTTRDKPKTINFVGGLEVMPRGKNKEASEAAASRELAPGTVAVRIAGITNAGVDVPLEAKLVWFYRQEVRGETLNATETFMINVTQTPHEMVTASPSFARSEYQGFALMLINPADKSVLWKRGSSTAWMNEATKLLEGEKK